MSIWSDGGTPSVLRSLNLRHSLRFIREHGPTTKAELIRETGLSRPTINDLVTELLDAELIVREPGKSRGGGTKVRFNNEAGFLLGIELEATNAVILLSDLAGTVLNKTDVRLQQPLGEEEVAQAISGATIELIKDHGGDPTLIACAAVAVPGVVAPETHRLDLAPTLAALEGTDLRSIIRFPCTTLVENNTQASARAESWRGVAQGYANVGYLRIGVGIGAAMQIDGRLYGGAHGIAGEVGYLSPFGLSSPHQPGTIGDLERAANLSAFLHRAKELAQANPTSSLGQALREHGSIGLKDIANAAIVQDPEARALIHQEAEYVAFAVISLILILDPEILVIGGPLAEMGEVFVGAVRSVVEMRLPGKQTLVVGDALGREGGALGAIRLAMEANYATIEETLRNR